MSTCLHQAYIDQLFISNNGLVIKIKLPTDIIYNLMPNCKYNNSNYRIDFETPIKSPFPDEYKYNGIDNTALLSLDETNSKNNLDDNLYNNNLAQYFNLDGILFLKNIFWCENTDVNKNIQLKIYKKFEFLDEINGNFLNNEKKYVEFAQILNYNNQIYNFYLFNDNFSFNNFVIDNNNNFAVIIKNIYKKDFSDYGWADSLIFYSIMHKNSTELNLGSNIIEFLKNRIKEYYPYLIKIEGFKKDYTELNEYINPIAPITYHKKI
jgi:hypothetical protein